MKISEIFRKEYIIEELKAKTKREVLEELSGVVTRDDGALNHELIVNTLLEREKLGSTGIGDGIAIPHGKLSDINELIVAFGRSRQGVEFDSMDGKPATESTTGLHLKALAKMSKMLKDAAFRKQLIEAKSKDELYLIIAEKDDAS